MNDYWHTRELLTSATTKTRCDSNNSSSYTLSKLILAARADVCHKIVSTTLFMSQKLELPEYTPKQSKSTISTEKLNSQQ